MLALLDILLTVIHLAFAVFNLTGWIWKKTRKAHLVTLGLTLISWFVFGFWYGWGYCFLTDWHWEIKKKMGERNLPNSFIKYFADKITGNDINSSLIDTVTLLALIVAVLAAIYVNFFARKKSP